jgi:hypothetical protein
VKSGATPTHYTPDGLAFDDGTELKADVIVFATGFAINMRELVGTIVGSKIESQLEDYWGLDSEGELRGAFTYTGRKFYSTPILTSQEYSAFFEPVTIGSLS